MNFRLKMPFIRIPSFPAEVVKIKPPLISLKLGLMSAEYTQQRREYLFIRIVNSAQDNIARWGRIPTSTFQFPYEFGIKGRHYTYVNGILKHPLSSLPASFNISRNCVSRTTFITLKQEMEGPKSVLKTKIFSTVRSVRRVIRRMSGYEHVFKIGL